MRAEHRQENIIIFGLMEMLHIRKVPMLQEFLMPSEHTDNSVVSVEWKQCEKSKS